MVSQRPLISGPVLVELMRRTLIERFFIELPASIYDAPVRVESADRIVAFERPGSLYDERNLLRRGVGIAHFITMVHLW